MSTFDQFGIEWFTATGEQGLIPQSRFDTDDYRWSRLIRDVRGGYEVTAIVSFDGVSSGGHMALKHWGPNHTSPCGHQEDGDCCCWYDCGIRDNGDIQTQIERPHPSNSNWTCTECTESNIGVGMDGNTIGLKWLVYPVIQGGSADNGGIRLKMWRSVNALSGPGGTPANNWVLVYDIVDDQTRDILADYNSPNDHDIEMRISDTDTADTYGGGLHYRKVLPSDVYGGGTGGGQPGGGGGPGPAPGETPPASNTDLKLFLSGGSENTNHKTSLGGLQSSHEFLGTEAHQILDRVDRNELNTGMDDYHMLYLQNTNQVRTYTDIFLFVYQNTISPFDQILIGLANAGKNSEEPALAFDTDVPAGPVVFTAAETPTQGLMIPSLGPNERWGIWIKRTVNPGAQIHAANIAKIAIDFSSSNLPSEPNVPPIPPTDPPDPDPGSQTNFTVCVFGDMGCSSRFQSSYNRAKARNPIKFLMNGDLGYDNRQECWIDIVEDERSKIIISIGNHDWNEDESQPSTLNATMSFGNFPSTSFYSTTFNNVGIIVLNSESEPHEDPQFSLMEQQLINMSNNSAIEWIFVMHHRPLYGTESHHPNEEEVVEKWHPLWDKYKVDAVITSHNHNKGASKLLRFNDNPEEGPANPIVVQEGGTYSYNRGLVEHGILFWYESAGGRSLRDFDASKIYYDDFINDNDFGYTAIDFSNNGHTATFKHFSRTDQLLYSCSLTHRD